MHVKTVIFTTAVFTFHENFGNLRYLKNISENIVFRTCIRNIKFVTKFASKCSLSAFIIFKIHDINFCSIHQAS